MNYPQAASASGVARAEKPRIAQQIEQLNKIISQCHGTAGDLEHVADRLLGPVPQDVAKETAAPPSDTVERKLAEIINYAEGLSSRLINSANRLNSAV